MLCFYLSRPFSQSSAKGETKTAMQKKIEKKAGKSGITIEWIVPSYFEKILNEPENADLREYFFCVEPSGGEQKVLPKCLTTIPSIDRNVGIIGRDDVMQNLRKMLDENGCIALISGLGGIGKTAVMRWICNSIKEDGNVKNHVAWITCGETLQNDIVLLRDAFGIPDSDDEKTAFKQIIERMKRFRGTLYLFMDSMYRNPDEDEMEILNSLYPNVHILISSRHEIEDIPFVNLEVLEHDQAVEMFYRYYGQVQERMCKSTAGSIVDTVYRHTLLVELLAKAARRSGGTLEDFNEKLKKENLVHYMQGDYKKALDYHHIALDIRLRLLGEIHPDIAMSYHNIASVLREQKNYPDAMEYCRKALFIWEQVLGSKHLATASGYNNMAKVFYAQGDYKKALEYYEKALSVRIEKLGENHPYTQNTQQAVQRTKSLIELG